MKLLWNDSPTGIPGQDDLGQMSSWYVFSALGMYPHYPGRAEMVLSSPVFSHVVIERPQRDIEIQTTGASSNNVYIQSLKVNGKITNNSWLPEDFIKYGGSLQFVLSDKANEEWGAGEENVPPSFSANGISGN